MTDIGAELYEAIKAEFDNAVSRDRYIQELAERIQAGKVTPKDIFLYAQQLGLLLRRAVEANISADKLPNGQMYYNIAGKILRPSLQTNYDLFNTVAAEIQKSVDKQQGIRIAAQQAKLPEERINAVISAASEPGIPEETMLRRMSVPAETITRSYADDYARANADFRSRAGIDEYIVRRDDGSCCEWCSHLAGRYRYPDEVPKDVYRRHDNCGCIVEHQSGGMRKNVHTKRSGTDEQQREALRELDERKQQQREKIRQAAENAKKPRVLSKAESSRIEAEVLAKRRERLTGEAESGIINVELDGYVPCLLDTKTGKLVDTEVSRVYDTSVLSECNERTGWDFPWNKPPADTEVYSLSIVDNSEIEGLIAIRKEPESKAVYMYWGNAAPHNKISKFNTHKKYEGVGGHLFAIAADISVKEGYGGFIYGDAANKDLFEKFVNKYGAYPLSTRDRPYRFCFDGEALLLLLNTYNFGWS